MDLQHEFYLVRRLIGTETHWINLPRKVQEAYLRQLVSHATTKEELCRVLKKMHCEGDWKVSWESPVPSESADEIAQLCRELGGLVSKTGHLVRIQLDHLEF